MYLDYKGILKKINNALILSFTDIFPKGLTETLSL